MTKIVCLVVTVIGALALAWTGSASATGKHNCHLFPGPGDNQVHMTRFQVKGIGCSKAKHVVRAGFRCGGCHAYTAKHLYWRTNLGFPDQHWISGHHKRIWIEWGD